MLANMRVGTKLAAILLAPLVLLAVLAGLGIAERAEKASDLRAAEYDAAASIAVSDLQFALQVEQMWGLARLTSNDGQSVRNFQDAGDASDQAAEVLQQAIAALDGTSVDTNDRINTVGDRLAAIAALRGDVTSGEAAVADVLFRHEQAADSLVGLIGAAVQSQLVPDIGADLGFAVTLSNARAAEARGAALLLAINDLNGSDTAADIAEVDKLKVVLDDAQVDANRYYAQFFADADAEFRSLLRNAQASSAARLNDTFRQQILDGGPADPVAVASTAIAELADAHALTGEIDEHTAEEASEERRAATRTAQFYLLGAGLGILLAVALAFLVARSITRPLRLLTQAAERISTEQLPALVSQLQAGASETATYEPIELKTRDEIGQLAVAFNTLQQVTVDVAQEQGALLRKGIGDIFVNLARRNQALLDRQIEFIDQLEANERDPDQLENLFRLDHLATRMRRNAESLLVLAGAETTRRRGRPVALADVVRVAVGEVADYSRLRVRTLDEVRVSAAVAVDLAHLLAELMENATQFSPPTTSVEVQGGFDVQGQYVITVTDRGIGIQDTQLAEFNELLARPPLMGLEISRSLGFVVIGRLAQRHGISVRLHAAPIHGVSAAIRLPASALGTAPVPGTEQGRPEQRGGQVARQTASTVDLPAGAAAGSFGGADPAARPDLVSPAAIVRPAGSDYPTPASARSRDDVGAGWERPAGVDSRVELRGGDLGGSGSSNGSGVTAPGFANGAGRVQRRLSGPPASPESFTYYEVSEDLDADPVIDNGVGQSALPLRGYPPEPAVQPLQPPALGLGPPVASDFTETERDVAEEIASAFPPLVLPTPAPPTPPVASPPPVVVPSITGAPVAEAHPDPDSETGAADLPIRRVPSMFSSASIAAATPQPPAEFIPPTTDSQDGTSGVEAEADPSRLSLPSRRPGMRAFEADQPGAPTSTERMRDLIGDGGEAEVAVSRGTPSPAAPSPTSQDREPPGGLLPSGLPSRRPAPAAPIGEPPVGLPLRPAGSSAALAPANGDGLTAAGLVRRSPKQQLRAMARGEPAAATRVLATQRSPEEVRKMLSRYRSGLQRGRTPGVEVAEEGGAETTPGLAPDGGPHAGRSAPIDEQGTEHAAEESPWRN